VRAEWNAWARLDPGFGERYGGAADRAAIHAGGKLESLLRTLHLAAGAGAIRPIRPGGRPPRAAGAGERAGRPPGVVSSFCDWYGFVVVPAAAEAFRRAVWGLFPAGGQGETVVATLRQSGVVPEGWRDFPRSWPWAAAWAGETPFVLRPAP
jgi:hypothetical protein